jgi:hypothetical protein
VNPVEPRQSLHLRALQSEPPKISTENTDIPGAVSRIKHTLSIAESHSESPDRKEKMASYGTESVDSIREHTNPLNLISNFSKLLEDIKKDHLID